MISNNIQNKHNTKATSLSENLTRMERIVDSIERNGLFPDMKTFYKIYGLIDHSVLGKSYGSVCYPVVEAASSDDEEADKLVLDGESDGCNNDEFSDDEGINSATVNLVSKKLTDKLTINYLVRKMFNFRKRMMKVKCQKGLDMVYLSIR
jgi:hypothetical protein